jgi:hypothetical protein
VEPGERRGQPIARSGGRRRAQRSPGQRDVNDRRPLHCHPGDPERLQRPRHHIPVIRGGGGPTSRCPPARTTHWVRCSVAAGRRCCAASPCPARPRTWPASWGRACPRPARISRCCAAPAWSPPGGGSPGAVSAHRAGHQRHRRRRRRVPACSAGRIPELIRERALVALTRMGREVGARRPKCRRATEGVASRPRAQFHCCPALQRIHSCRVNSWLTDWIMRLASFRCGHSVGGRVSSVARAICH